MKVIFSVLDQLCSFVSEKDVSNSAENSVVVVTPTSNILMAPLSDASMDCLKVVLLRMVDLLIPVVTDTSLVMGLLPCLLSKWKTSSVNKLALNLGTSFQSWSGYFDPLYINILSSSTPYFAILSLV